MPLNRLPSLADVVADPSLLADLPAPVIARYKEFLSQAVRTARGLSDIPPDPISLAVRFPRFSWLDTPHLRYLSEKVAESVELHKPTIVCMPPRHGKSTTCSIWTPFWYLARFPTRQVALVSYGAEFAKKWGLRVRRLVELFGADYGLTLSPDKMAAHDWELISGGGMFTTGVGGGISGRQVDLFIVDDLLKDQEEASSQVIRDKTWEWWETTAMQRIEPTTTVFGIGTRYHEDDILGRLISQAASDGMPFDVVSIPAKAEAGDILGREMGAGLWLSHFPQTYYDAREKAVTPYVWSSVYQQQPSPVTGNIIDPSWWKFYLPSQLPRSFDQEIQTWDLALDSKKKSDSYQSGLVVARTGTDVYVRDCFHEHTGIEQVISTILAWNRIYPGARQKIVERFVSGNAVVQTLRSKVPGMLAWPPKGRRKESKEALLTAAVPDVRAGCVHLPLHADGTRPRWVDEFIEELRQFPRAPNDDYVDTFSQAMNFFFGGIRRAVDKAHEQANAVAPITSPGETHTRGLHAAAKAMLSQTARSLPRYRPDDEDGEAGGSGWSTSNPSLLPFRLRPRDGAASRPLRMRRLC